MNFDVLSRRAGLLQKMFSRNFNQIPQVAVPQNPLAIDYVPTPFCYSTTFPTYAGGLKPPWKSGTSKTRRRKKCQAI